MENAACCRTLQRSLRVWGLEKSTHVCPQTRNRPWTPQWCGAGRHRQGAVGKGLFNDTDTIAAVASPSNPVKISSNHVHVFFNKLLPDATLFGKTVVGVERHHYLLPLGGCCQKEARDSTPCITQPDSPSNTLSGQDAPDIVKVDGFDFDVGKESVLVEKYCASSVVGHVEPVREELVVDIINRLLQSNDVPFPCDLLLDSAFSSTSGSWVPVVVAESFLYSGAVRHVDVEVIFLIGSILFSGRCFAEFCVSLPNVLPRNPITSLRQGTAISDDRDRDYAALCERNCTHVFW